MLVKNSSLIPKSTIMGQSETLFFSDLWTVLKTFLMCSGDSFNDNQVIKALNFKIKRIFLPNKLSSRKYSEAEVANLLIKTH